MLRDPPALSGPSARSDIPPFHAMAMAARATRRAATGADVLHLEVGQPSTPAPALVREAARQALEQDPLGYTNAAGLWALRERIARHYADGYGLDVSPEEVVVTAGASAGFVLTFLACFDAGDRVGVVAPGYPCYRNTLLALGVEPVAIPVGPATRWAPTPDLLADAGRLDGLVVASPSNPTGTMLGREALAALAAHCTARGTRLVSDEIYHGLTFAGPATCARAVSADALVLNSFSKYYSMTGWRLGWIVAPAALVPAIERFQQSLYICAPSLSQVAALAAFDCAAELDAHVERYAANRVVLLEGLSAAGIVETADSDGAFYVYAEVGHLLDASGLADSLALCEHWIDELGVATTPGVDFDLDRGGRFVRFSYAGDERDIAEACRRLVAWWHRLR
jgi:aspartate/methionine/tyrosine aminotransferase